MPLPNHSLRMKKTVLLSLLVPSVIAVFSILPIENDAPVFHSAAERAFFNKHGFGLMPDPAHYTGAGGLLPIDSNIYFPTAKLCGGCHGFDPNEHALVTTEGKDVNVYDDWRSTMMANSARDPFWRAKVTHEILANPAHSLELQDKCTSCHAPSGHYQAKLRDHQQYYLLSDLYADTLGLDGVSCQTCHAQSPDLLGDLRGMTQDEYVALKQLCDRFPELPTSVQEKLLRDVWRPIAIRRSIPDLQGVHPIFLAEAKSRRSLVIFFAAAVAVGSATARPRTCRLPHLPASIAAVPCSRNSPASMITCCATLVCNASTSPMRRPLTASPSTASAARAFRR